MVTLCARHVARDLLRKASPRPSANSSRLRDRLGLEPEAVEEEVEPGELLDDLVAEPELVLVGVVATAGALALTNSRSTDEHDG